MPPRYAYWTILVDDQPTAFRSGSQEELMPTFNRLQQKHASAKMMWWQNGKLWASRIDAQEAMRARGEIGRSRDVRQRPADRYSNRAPSASERREERGPSGKLDWKPKGSASSHIAPGFSRGKPHEKPEWKPKGSFKPERSAKPDWKPKGSFKPERSATPDWKPKSSSSRHMAPGSSRGERQGKPDWKPKPRSSRPPAAGKLEWTPKGEGAPRARSSDAGAPEKRKWVPKAEYKKSLGIEAKKDKNWRPGGEHKDPRQKYKDAKKAKWGRFKQTVRKRWEAKGKNDK